MKKAISLVEVLVSIMLITSVIVVILQMKENNLFLLNKINSITMNNNYISYAIFDEIDRNEKIYLSDKVDFDDDVIRKELKDIQIIIQDKHYKTITVLENNYIKSINITESSYTLNNSKKTTIQKFYTFTLEEE